MNKDLTLYYPKDEALEKLSSVAREIDWPVHLGASYPCATTGMSIGVVALSKAFKPCDLANTIWDTEHAENDIWSCEPVALVGQAIGFAGGGPSVHTSFHQGVYPHKSAANFRKAWRRQLAAPAESVYRVNFDSLLEAVLVDVSKVDRFESLPDMNVVHLGDLDFLSRTTSPSSALDERAVCILESRQQRDAILLSKDFRTVLETLVEEEQFSYYDLTRAIGVTRAMLGQWRDRPLEKVRQASHARMGRLLFAWKYWLHVTEGDMLGRYLRHVPEGSTASLLDLLSSKDPTDEEIATLVDRLARYAAEDRKAGAQRRRNVGGLPQGAHRQDLVFD